MRIHYAELFVRQFKGLTHHEQELVRDAIEIFEHDPFDASLRNHELRKRPGFRSISADVDLRIIFRQRDDYAEVIMLMVGDHGVYDL